MNTDVGGTHRYPRQTLCSLPAVLSTLKGLIWGGTPPPRTSRSLCSSPIRARTPLGRGNGAALFGSTLDGGVSELERSRGIRSAKRCRPPSPARHRQMEADNARYHRVLLSRDGSRGLAFASPVGLPSSKTDGSLVASALCSVYPSHTLRASKYVGAVASRHCCRV